MKKEKIISSVMSAAPTKIDEKLESKIKKVKKEVIEKGELGQETHHLLKIHGFHLITKKNREFEKPCFLKL
jgi:hypothetical protein